MERTIIQKQYIGYYRVSTKSQGKSGLGLESQKQSVKDFIVPDGVLVNEYQDIESGKNSDRPNLLKAIEECKITDSVLLIAKLDRLSRNAKFIFTLRDSNVKFISVDMPEANNLTIGIMAVLAQDEAERTSKRTKAALQVIKDKINRGETHISKSGKVVKSLGSPKNLTDAARKKGCEVRQRRAANNTESIKAGAFIVTLKESGLSFYKIANKLNQSGFTTPRGGEFNQVQTKRLYERYKES